MAMEQISDIPSDGVIPSFVTCVLCLDDVDVNNPDVYVDACPDDSHPGFHKECLLQYIDSKVKMGKWCRVHLQFVEYYFVAMHAADKSLHHSYIVCILTNH